MAVRLDAGGEKLETAGNPTGASTMCGWLARRGTGNGTFEGMFRWGGNSADLTNANAVYYMLGTPNRWEIWASDNGGPRGSYTITMTADQWYFLALVDSGGASGSNIELFSGTESELCVSRIAATRGATGLTSVETWLGEGWSDPGVDWFNGNFFNWMMFDRALTRDELRMLQISMMPPSPYRPWGHWRLWRSGDLDDISGNGRTLTSGGTPTTETPNPAIQLGRWMPRFSRASGGVASLTAAQLVPIFHQSRPQFLMSKAKITASGMTPPDLVNS